MRICVAEAAFHLSSIERVQYLVRDEMLRVAFDLHSNLDQLEELAHRYKDRKPDLAALCLIRMSELYPRQDVITVDVSDFSGLPPEPPGSHPGNLSAKCLSLLWVPTI